MTNIFFWIGLFSFVGAGIIILCACKVGGDYDRDMEYTQTKDPEVSYICDGKACDGGCNAFECHHTTDVKHAKNFKRVADSKWMEVEQ